MEKLEEKNEKNKNVNVNKKSKKQATNKATNKETSEEKTPNKVTNNNAISEEKTPEKPMNNNAVILEEKTEEEKTNNAVPEEKNDNVTEENKEKKDGLNLYAKIIVIISVILLIGAIIFSTIFALLNKGNDKVISGVSVKGVDISNLTYDEAKNKISDIYKDKVKQNIILKHGDYEISLTPEQIETNFAINDSIDIAYNIGRSGKILKDNYTILNTKIHKIDISPATTYNEKALSDFIESISGNLPDAVKESEYYVENNKLIISKGEKGSVVETEKLKRNIVNTINSINTKDIIIEIPTVIKEPDAVDIQKIHDEIYKEPKDAYYTKDPFTVYPHVDGVDFEITIDEAKNLLNTNEAQIIIPLKISKPNVTTNQIGTEAFPNLLATYTTTFSTKNTNRATNIRLASNKINGVVLLPGEQFSYNNVVGKRTSAAGYKPAQVYVGGKLDTGIGGGICQVSTTLYNSALKANLEIIKRSNHRFAATYVPLSQDATVSWGGPDFVFKNSRKYPIKIVSSVSGGSITVSIYGCKEEVEYEVIIQSEKLSTISMKTEYRTNTSLPAGTKKTVQKGHAGYKSRAYRILKLDGKVVSKQLLSTDTYAQLPTIIEQN